MYGNIFKNLSSCKNIVTTAKTQDLLEILEVFMSENNLDWIKCIYVCTEEVQLCLAGIKDCRLFFNRNQVHNELWIHHILQKVALASKHLSLAENQAL